MGGVINRWNVGYESSLRFYVFFVSGVYAWGHDFECSSTNTGREKKILQSACSEIIYRLSLACYTCLYDPKYDFYLPRTANVNLKSLWIEIIIAGRVRDE